MHLLADCRPGSCWGRPGRTGSNDRTLDSHFPSVNCIVHEKPGVRAIRKVLTQYLGTVLCPLCSEYSSSGIPLVHRNPRMVTHCEYKLHFVNETVTVIPTPLLAARACPTRASSPPPPEVREQEYRRRGAPNMVGSPAAVPPGTRITSRGKLHAPVRRNDPSRSPRFALGCR